VPRKLLARGAAIALTAVAIGCGGNDDEPAATTETPGPLTRADFIEEADLICQTTDRQIEAAGDDLVADLPPRETPSDAQVRRFALGTLIPRLEEEIRAIRALGIPPGDEKKVEEILAATRQGIAQIKRQVREDPQALRQGANPPAIDRANKLARDYGSFECGTR
jgi:hypothetical protein